MFVVTPGLEKSGKNHGRWPKSLLGYLKGTGQVEENRMTLLLAIEASKPNGTVYRLAIGCTLLPLVSWLAGITRLL